MSIPKPSTGTTIEATPIREFMSVTPNDLLNKLRIGHNVLFEDNVVMTMSWTEIVLTRYVLELLTLAPHLPVVSKYSVVNYYTNGIYTSKTVSKAMEKIVEDIILHVAKPSGTRAIIPRLCELIYRRYNVIYNEMVYSLLDYAGSVDIEDFTELQFDPRLIASIKEASVEKTVASINKTYDVLDKVIKENPENNISRGYISTTINPNQVKQLLAGRGFVTDIDSKIYNYPIAASYVLGMSSMPDMAIESRAAAKALSLSTKAVQQSEYFARELQLVTMNVEKLIHGDCGTKQYTDIYIRVPEDGAKSDIPMMVGKYYLNDQGVEEVITSKHTFLEGKTIKLRSVLNCCLVNKGHVCSKCYGELAYSIPEHANIGHYSATFITQKLTQNILSTKHLTGSAIASAICLSEDAKQFLVTKGGNQYVFKPTLLGKARTKYSLLVTQHEAFGIKDITKDVDVYRLRPSWVSRIKSIIMCERTEAGNKYTNLVINDNKRLGSFTYRFLNYIKEYGYTLDDKDRYVIDLDNWINNVPFIELPNLEFSFLALTKLVQTELKWRKNNKKDNVEETVQSFLLKFHDILNSKLEIPFVHTEIVVYGLTVADPANRNFDMGRNIEEPTLSNFVNILSNRSLGAGYGWERVLDTMLTPHSFDGRNAINHPMDVMVRPNETLAEYKRLNNIV